MKPKTALRWLRRNESKLAKLKSYGKLRSYEGLGKKWKKYVSFALAEQFVSLMCLNLYKAHTRY